jgi:hypothetical protein
MAACERAMETAVGGGHKPLLLCGIIQCRVDAVLGYA